MISVGILSHFAPETLRFTLFTYMNAGLFDCSDDIFVVIQKSDRQEEERQVCESVGVRAVCLPDNDMMGSGFKAIYENARHEFIMFLENDFVAYTSREETRDFFINTVDFLLKGVDLVRARSRANPGQPNYAYDSMHNKPRSELVNSTHLSESIFWEEHPHEVYPTCISKLDCISGSKEWYKSSSKFCNYTNNPYACSKTFFKNAVLPYTMMGGTNNIEDFLTPIWAKEDYTCAFGPGLFTHDRRYDGHR